MKYTFDTNVLLSATLWDGSVAQKLLFSCIQQDVILFSSEDILKEYVHVLERDFSLEKTLQERHVCTIRSFMTFVVPLPLPTVVVKDDPSDDVIIACALASESTHIVTYDKHLLRIGSYEGITIVTPELARHLLSRNH